MLLLSEDRPRPVTYAQPGDGDTFLQSLGDTISSGGEIQNAPWLRVTKAAYRTQLIVDNSNARQQAIEEAADRRISDVAKATGVTLENPERGAYQNEAMQRLRADAFNAPADQPVQMGGTDFSGGIPGMRRRIFDEKIAALQQANPDKAEFIRADVPLENDARAAGGAAEHTLQTEIANPNLTTGGAIFGSLAGGVAASFRDPLQVALLFASGGTGTATTAAARIGQVALREGLINAGTVALMQPAVQAWRSEIGLRSGVLPAVENVGLAFLVGGIVGAPVQGIRELRSAPKAALERVATGRAEPGDVELAAGALKLDMSAATKRVVASAEQGIIADRTAIGTAPTGVPPERAQEVISQAIRHAENPATSPPPEILDALPARPRDQLRIIDESEATTPSGRQRVDGKPVTFQSFDPRTLGTDADTFQYKGNADGSGVTDRLRFVTDWDPTASGKTFVFERNDGSRVIADGHQRLGLAARLLSENPGAPIKMDGFLFRQADGWTAGDVRALAAKKNMQEGSGDALDAARILRERPDILDGSLPVSGPMMKNAIALAKLSDEGFGMALNGVVPLNQAAAVGAMVPKAAEHAAVLADLARIKPETEREARLLIGEIMAAGFRPEEQINLFGASIATRSLMAERVKVLDTGLSQLGKDRRLFGTLAQQAEAIESAGNLLARDANAQRASDATTLGDLLARLAQRTGPVSDALNRAAAQMAEGMAPKKAADAFLSDVRAVLDRDGLAGLLAEPTLKPGAVVEPGTAHAAAMAETSNNVLPFPKSAVRELDLIPVPAGEDGRAMKLVTRDAALAEADRTAYHADLVAACKA